MLSLLLDRHTISFLSSFIKPQPSNPNILKIFTAISTQFSNKVFNEDYCTTRSESTSSSSPPPLMDTCYEYSKVGLRKEMMPKHVATIFDGNRRWLKAQGRTLDYEPFFRVNALFVDLCLKWGVDFATTFVYSVNTLQRGKEANDVIFGQLEIFLRDNIESFIRENVSVLMIGEKKFLPKSLQDMIKHVEESTKYKIKKARLEFRLAICYTGTRDIVEATRRLCEKAKAGLIEPNAIDEEVFGNQLSTRGAPPPDLLIRCGDEFNLSNYLMWQLANTVLYFSPIYGPEFTEVHFLEALRAFQERYRSFGN